MLQSSSQLQATMTSLRRFAIILIACISCWLATVAATPASVAESCASSSSSDACTSAATVTSAHDPYAPPTPTAAPAADGSTAEPPRLMHMWTTPLFVAQPRFRDVGAFNRALSQRALDAFDALLARPDEHQGAAAPLQHRGDDAQGANERFFAWQRDQHAMGRDAEPAYLAMVQSKEFKSLLHLFDSYTRAFLEAAGAGSEWLALSRKPPLFCWATVARDGNCHLSHTHPGHMLSGVYYSRIPADGVGALVFDDPRGPRWPFEGRFIHHPKPGDLILFPAWLVHAVTPTTSQNHETRISWSCNVQGSWEELSDINLV